MVIGSAPKNPEIDVDEFFNGLVFAHPGHPFLHGSQAGPGLRWTDVGGPFMTEEIGCESRNCSSQRTHAVSCDTVPTHIS